MRTNISKMIKRSCMAAAFMAAGFGFNAEKAHANAEVVYFYNTYNNPAMMDLLTKNFEVMAGGAGTDLQFKYKGTQVGRGPGTSKSQRYNFHPYGNLMYRIPQAEKWVVGFDISGPAFDNMFYKHGPARGTKAVVRGNFYNWKVSYQAFDNFTIGFGIFLGHLRAGDYSFQLPAAAFGFRNRDYLQFITKTKGSKAGWNAGFLWKAAQGTFISGSVWSRIKGYTRGHADVYNTRTGQLLASRQIKVTAFEPNNFELSALQFLSKEWLISLTGRYMVWKIRKNFTFYSMPIPTPVGVETGPLNFALNYKNSWVISGFTRYQFDPQWAVLGAFNYNSNPNPLKTRPVIFPVSWTWFLGTGIQYMPTENWKATLFGGCGWSKAKIDHEPERAFGKSKLFVPTIDLNLTYHF